MCDIYPLLNWQLNINNVYIEPNPINNLYVETTLYRWTTLLAAKSDVLPRRPGLSLGGVGEEDQRSLEAILRFKPGQLTTVVTSTGSRSRGQYAVSIRV